MTPALRSIVEAGVPPTAKESDRRRQVRELERLRGKPLDQNDLLVEGLLPDDPWDDAAEIPQDDEHGYEPGHPKHEAWAKSFEKRAKAKDLSDRVAAGDTNIDPEAESTPMEGVVPRPRYRILGPEEIFAPLPEPVYTIGGLLRRSNLALVVAFGSSLKTWLAVDLLIAAAIGGRFIERFDCEPCLALGIDWESGDEELRRRIQADARARGLTFPVAGIHVITMPDLFFTSPDFEAVLEELAETYKLIVFDSLAAGSLDLDENDARFAKGLQICRRVGERKGASIVVLHHSRKDGGEDSDERQSVRGSGAIFAAADVVLSLRRSKSDDAFQVRQTKARGGKRVEPFVLRVEDTAGGVRVYATDLDEQADDVAAAETASSALDRAKRAILAILSTSHDVRSGNELVRRLKGGPGSKGHGRNVVLDALRELTERGIITTNEGALRLSSEVPS